MRFAPYVLAGVVVSLSVMGYGQLRYHAGQAERKAHYEVILKAIADQAAQDKARRVAREREAAAINAAQEKRHAEIEVAAKARDAASRERISGLVSQLAGCRAVRLSDAAGGAAEESQRAAQELERIQRIGDRIARTGANCESDARRILEWQQYYDNQRRNGSR